MHQYKLHPVDINGNISDNDFMVVEFDQLVDTGIRSTIVDKVFSYFKFTKYTESYVLQQDYYSKKDYWIFYGNFKIWKLVKGV